MFKQRERYIVDFIIKFEALTMKTDIDDLHIIFLLKKNMQIDIIKMILEYLLVAAPKTLKKQKVAIILVRQGYESMEGQQDYRIETRTIYEERGIPMDIGKAKDNFDKDEKSKYFNCNIYRYMAKDCKKPRKEQDTKKYYKYKKVGHCQELQTRTEVFRRI